MKYKCPKCGEDKEMDVKAGDILVSKKYGDKTRVLATLGDVIITEHPLNSSWSNKVYSTAQFVGYLDNWELKAI